MERWSEWVVALLVAAAIVALVALARGEPGRGDLPATATVVTVAAR